MNQLKNYRKISPELIRTNYFLEIESSSFKVLISLEPYLVLQNKKLYRNR